MKCANRVVYATKRRINASAHPTIVSCIPSAYWNTYTDYYRKFSQSNIERYYIIHHIDEPCGGNIVSNLTFDPGYFLGGADPEFTIRFTCDRCGGYEHPNLPRDLDDVNKLLTKCISKL